MNANFRKMLLKAWGNTTGNFDFQSTRIRIAGHLQTVWQTPDSLLIQYMIDKGGDFRSIHSLNDIRSAAVKTLPRKKVIPGAGVLHLTHA